MKEGGEHCVVPEGRYVLIRGISTKQFTVKTELQVTINEGGEVCVGSWGRYSTIEATPAKIFLLIIPNSY